MWRIKKLCKVGKRGIAGFLAVILTISGIKIPAVVLGSDVWPQKSTAPYYCLDGGKSWKSTDRYEVFQYDTLPSTLTETQARRLFWAYPSNWNALKEAAKKYDSELYSEIASTISGPNVVKKVKDDGNSKYAWVADNPEIEQRAITALERAADEGAEKGKVAPLEIREATSEDTAVTFTLPAFGPGALDTEFKLGADFISDIANIEAESVWDNGSGGGESGWLDASLGKNIAEGTLGNQLYEITWNNDAIVIHNNGSAAANESAIGSNMSEEEKYNKTMVRYKITMRENSGWYSAGQWDEDYLHEWMDFKACVNAPGHQRLYKADIKIVPSDMVFYMVVKQQPPGEDEDFPEYGGTTSDVSFQLYRHTEEFQSHYNVKLKKIDDETEKPIKGSQFYLYERFDDAALLGESEENGGLTEEKLNFSVWNDYQIFSEGTTDANGELTHTDIRTYSYSKTYCDGHGMPEWASIEEIVTETMSETEEGTSQTTGEMEAVDQNIAAAEQWLQLYHDCEEMEESSGGTHFHWLIDDQIYDAVESVMESGMPEWEDGPKSGSAKEAFEQSGCKRDCEKTYETFINLRFSYTWKEVQAKQGYILHGVHESDTPIEAIMTNASEAGADSILLNESSDNIEEDLWYSGEVQNKRRNDEETVVAELEKRIVQVLMASSSNAESSDIKTFHKASDSEAQKTVKKNRERSDDEWKESSVNETFDSYFESAELDGIQHLTIDDQTIFSYPDSVENGKNYWLIRNHRTEGEIHINKRDIDLFKEESDEYSAYGDAEGDASLQGAAYGLFAAEDIIHPDSELTENGLFTNTGVVYRKHDLVAVAMTDDLGNASFNAYTEAPGNCYNYETNKIEARTDITWSGPENRYQENYMIHGNWWIGRPLILGSYYIKELSRSEGYELSVNGKSKLWTNYGESIETPEGIADITGTAMVSMMDAMVSMEGEDFVGNGYDQIPFRVISSDTSGYNIMVSGLPEGTEFYRVDSGETAVTGPRVTGTENVIVRSEDGEILWKKADSNHRYLKYSPKYDDAGNLTGQIPVSKTEWQILKDQQVPAVQWMEFTNWNVDLTDARWNQPIERLSLKEKGEDFCFLKAELETFLWKNGYETPETYDGVRSQSDRPVYSEGVKKGQVDLYGMTAGVGETAVKTVYGAAIREIMIDDVDEETSLYELFASIVTWYAENPQWSFGGLHSLEVTEEGCFAVVYAGASTRGNRRFFTFEQEGEALVVDKVYTVIENPAVLRWEYQEYKADGLYHFDVLRKYFYGSGNEKRYYIDVVLSPAVMVDKNGEIQPLEHAVMEYHEEGEEIIDYLLGDPEYGYRVPETRLEEIIEITTENEYTEQDIRMEDVLYDEKTGQYQISVEMDVSNSFGELLSDQETPLELSFVAKLPQATIILTKEDVKRMESRTFGQYQAGDEIGYGEYLIALGDMAIGISSNTQEGLEDTYIMTKQLVYRSQYKVLEDGGTTKSPVQILERPIKQKVKIVKQTESGEPVGNFQFKIYLKSNLEDLYCDANGAITWLDRSENVVDIMEYKRIFPELVQKLYTRKTDRRILEIEGVDVVDAGGDYVETENYNYQKFFDAIKTANTDKWENTHGYVKNTSAKPFAKGMYTGKMNEINTSVEAKENAERSDAVRQFAVTWYLEEKIQELTKEVPELKGLQAKEGTTAYADEIYDRALYLAIQDAEVYLQPFFKYDLDTVYQIMWDGEVAGGADNDFSTLTANQFESADLNDTCAYGVSEYLPYGEYVVVELQPKKGNESERINRHYEIDAPQELALPQHEREDGSLEDHSEVLWSLTEPGEKEEMSGYAIATMTNKLYQTVLRIEKTDLETGEPILHDDTVFALYKAERNDDEDGSIKRYSRETLISGSRLFLEAMGARQITSFVRNGIIGKKVTNTGGIGAMYWGYVPAGTPVCKEEDCVIFTDINGIQQGTFQNLSSTLDCTEQNLLQNAGYIETPEPVAAGVYVLAELKAPSGYTRNQPIAIEVYSDCIQYGQEQEHVVSAVKYGGILENSKEFARIYVTDTATSLEVEKKKPTDSYQGMKISGRVEGSKSALDLIYGLENLELAYNSVGTYLGFGWKKGTLEYLENRKESGESIELVYENGVFQGYGYIRRSLETSEHKNPYVAGATLALFDAIEVRRSGDSEDFAFEGVEVERDRSGNVTSIKVKEGYAGNSEELVKSDTGTWKVEVTNREDTEVLFYDLHELKVLEKAADGTLYGFDRSGQKMKITFDTESIFAVRNGKAEFELYGGDFSKAEYDKASGAFVDMDANTVIYHLDEDGCRDAQVDGYTGLAYVEKSGIGPLDVQESHLFVWPVREIKNSLGHVIFKEKILTGRPGEVNAGTEYAYITGSVSDSGQSFEKVMNPVYDSYGMVEYYPESEVRYKTGENLYDRDGEFIGYRCEELLEEYNRASYGILDPIALYGSDRKENLSVSTSLKHRKGEAWIVPNVWTTGTLYPQDPSNEEITEGQRDLLRRVVPGTYIMEELKAPEGYVRSMPMAVSVEDTAMLQSASLENERIKVEIAKVDGTTQYQKMVIQDTREEETEWSTENKGSYSGEMILGAKLALYRAERVYTSDYSRYPKGYYLEKKEDIPAKWYVEDPEDNSGRLVEAVWITNDRAKYFEGIPAGDYILEELETPKGYLPASMEITVNPIQELQSFILRDDHTKVEVYKYEKDDSGNKVPLSCPDGAELTLYPAELDHEGNAKIVDGDYMYKNIPAARWTTGQSAEYKERVCREYENMYALYGSNFESFTWQWSEGEEQKEGRAKLEECKTTANNETVIQLWRLEDQSLLRITVGKNDGAGVLDHFGRPRANFAYQFDYVQGDNAEISDMVSYELFSGIRRIDRIPAGTYILVETKVPDGYKAVDPVVIVVNETDAVQRFFIENGKEDVEPKGTLVIEKMDAGCEEEKLAGALFEIKNLQSGATFLLETDELGRATLTDLPINGVYDSGISGPCIYQIKELAAPDGYRPNITTWNIRILDDGSGEVVQKLVVKDEKTKFSFLKSDFSTGHFVPGATLSIYETGVENGTYVACGEPLETWTSSGEAHMIEGKLSCGRTYLLVEEDAPEGYLIADPVRFTVSSDGTSITDISANLTQVHIEYKDGAAEVESISIVGQAAKNAEYILTDEGRNKEIRVKGSGQPIAWNKEMEEYQGRWSYENGEILVTEEYVEFWDGSQVCVERAHFRIEEDSCVKPTSSGRYPIATEFVLKNAEGVRIDAWSISSGTYCHKLENVTDQAGVQRFQIGERYTLEEFVTFSDGKRLKIHAVSICLGQTGEADIELFDQETRLEVKKTDITTGREIPGAVLAIKDENGVILEQWISSEKEHIIEGILNPGEQYVLSETMAADGYAYAKEILFTLHENGCIERIVMEDRLTDVQIRKIDGETEKELPGAAMSLRNSEGKLVEQWVSGKKPHVIRGKLIAGETYTLMEDAAPSGYHLAEPIKFTVALDGSTDQIIMENHRIQLEDTDEPEETEQPKEEKSSQHGRITAKYEIKMEGDGVLRIRIPEGATITMIPKTSDAPFPWWSVLGAGLSFVGCVILWKARKKENGK